MRQGRGAQKRRPFAPQHSNTMGRPAILPQLPVPPPKPKVCRSESTRATAGTPQGSPRVPPVLPAEPPQFHSMLPKSPAQPPRIPHSACKFARAAQSSPDMPPNGRTAAAAAPESWRLARHVRDCGSTALACAKAMAHRIGDHLHPSIPTLWAGPRNTPRDPAFATGTDNKANTVHKFPHRRRLATTAART